MRQIIFDTETTGLDPAQGHRIVEIGCVEIVNRVVTGRNLHIYLNPDRDSDPEALAVHGLTTEFLSDKPRFGDVADQFISFIEGAELIAH
ncbi:DNA polymerase III subunit epsilon, partial [Bordetella hinzii]|nr:DNA polymerase III subunit epsilon [Bordetella hinzii]